MLRVTSSSSAVNELPLYVSQDVERGGLMRRGLDSLMHLALRWVPL
jgi:D-alanyl-D-alanine carboxypeptidase (penicillin-binding protein 5/6)